MSLLGILGGLGGLFGVGAGSGVNGGAAMAQNAAVEQASNALMAEEAQDQLASLQQYTRLERVQADYNRKQRTATTVATMAEQEDSLMLSIQGAINTLTKSATDMVKSG